MGQEASLGRFLLYAGGEGAWGSPRTCFDGLVSAPRRAHTHLLPSPSAPPGRGRGLKGLWGHSLDSRHVGGGHGADFLGFLKGMLLVKGLLFLLLVLRRKRRGCLGGGRRFGGTRAHRRRWGDLRCQEKGTETAFICLMLWGCNFPITLDLTEGVSATWRSEPSQNDPGWHRPAQPLLHSHRVEWGKGPTGKPGTHKQPRHRPCSFNEPGHISREKKVLENHLSSFSFSKNLITSNWCCRHTTGAHPALFPRAAAPSTWGDRGMGAPWILLPRSVCWEQVGFTHGGRPVSPQEPRNKHGLCKN